MSSNWLDKLKDYPPSIASAILTGGATLPQLAYKAIQDATGIDVKTIEQAQAAVESATPDQIYAIKQANYTFKLEMERLDVERLSIVNDTMRGESKSDKWWVSGWRPFTGFIFGLSFLAVTIFVCAITYKAASISPDPMSMIPQIIFNFTTLFAIPGGILGIASHHRGKEKRAQI